MANVRIATTTRNNMLQALIDDMNLGSGPATLKIYSGVQPANGDAGLSGNTLLGTLTFSDPAASAPASGSIDFDVITEDSAADATETATWARIEDSDGTNVFDCDVGEAGATLILNTTDIVLGGPIRITSFTLTIPAA